MRESALNKMRDALVKRRRNLMNSLEHDLDALRVLSHGSDDIADLAQDYGDQVVNSQRAEVESREIAAIEEALDRIESGIYGTCSDCGEKIALARLTALPFVEFCVSCQVKSEKKNR